MRVLQLLPELNAGSVETGTLETVLSLVQAGYESSLLHRSRILLRQHLL